MRQIVSESAASERFQVILLASFAAAALTLALLGIHGVLAFVTSRRTAEIGIRMALGARPSQMLGSVLQSGMAPVLAGIVAGLLVAVAFARVLQRVMLQVRALDPATYVSVTLAMLSVAAFPCYMPVRCASRLDPASALRHE